jgi:beta-glucanase (GH16 family)
MKNIILIHLLLVALTTAGQSISVEDDFEGSGSIDSWFSVDCNLDTSRENPWQEGINTSSTVLEYHDLGGLNAQIGFDVPANFNLADNHTFTLKIYVPSSSVTGNQENRLTLKLQDGNSPDPTYSETEITLPIQLDQWQQISFDFGDGNFENAFPALPSPVERTDFNRVILQVNGQANNDLVRAYIDDIEYDGEVVLPSNNSIYTELVWSDEFEQNGAVNSENWHHQTELPTANGWYNGELQHYTDRIENSYVEDGFLHIAAIEETYTDQDLTLNYTSARLNSKFAFTYGRVEVRARLPFGSGTWPAIWTLGKNIIEPGNFYTEEFGEVFWPACGEIDIMEHWGTNQNYVSAALHTPSSFGATENNGGIFLPDVSNTFHVYSMEWSPEEIRFFVDGINYYTYDPLVQNPETWPFTEDQYLLLNVAMINPVAPNFSRSDMIIDYVRVYQESLGTQNPSIDSDIRIFPNPATSLTNLRLNSEFLGGQIVIYSAQGEIINQLIIQSNLFSIDMSAYPSGIYVMLFRKGDRQVARKIVVE